MLCAIALASLGSSVSSTSAQTAIDDSYCTQISERDKQASDGYPLTDAGSILRQDRANLHRYGRPDRGDDGDFTFVSQNARAQIPQLVTNGNSDPAVLDEIVYGTPSVCVNVYRNHMDVWFRY
ncbi:hypothetical protein FP2506_02205 [Fulvimarina pelagi HTCC2506]|uniref:Uncharacterized protein n=2 Tax=Fulvimarina pelagi TaxID=217511 RepID=Q0FYH9_9HYPH|nr:hypothetical protein FP2506_02205 [Fulvimarina pelagi HTCC2506]BAT31058.1 hypothetical protein [Fulvimarina pelagi]